MQEQLQNEKDLQAALDAGLGISQIAPSENVDEMVSLMVYSGNARF